MKYINHITLNSGDVRRTYSSEINKDMYFIMKRILNESYSRNGVELFDGYILKSTQDSNGTVGTIYKNSIPIITTAAVNADPMGIVWNLLHESATTPLVTNIKIPYATPYIADRIELGAGRHMDAMEWTGDFARCYGWIVLAPQMIR